MLTETQLLTHKIHHEAQRYGPVSKRAAERAAEWLAAMSEKELPGWIHPTAISGSSDGEVVMEWWNGDRDLTVYFGASTQSLLRIWGTDMDDEMAEECPKDIDISVAAWTWLREKVEKKVEVVEK